MLFTKAAYDATWQPQVQPPVPEAAAEENHTDAAKEWKFHAAQLTYNCTTGEWASHDHSVLNGLFRRMLAFAKELGIACTLVKCSKQKQKKYIYNII